MRALAQGEVVIVVMIDEEGRLNLRRVRIRQLRKSLGRLVVVGENMKGKNAITYNLPAEPWDSIHREPETSGWLREAKEEVE